MKWIEFIGVPGVGKTNLSQILSLLLKKAGFRVFSDTDLIYRYINQKFCFFKFLFFLPFSAKKFLSIKLFNFLNIRHHLADNYCKSNPRHYQFLQTLTEECVLNQEHAKLVMKWNMNTITNYHLAQTLLRQEDILIVSEGFYHKTLSIFPDQCGQGNLLEKLSSYVSKIPPIHKLIYIKENPQFCIKTNSCKPRLLRTRDFSEEARATHIKNVIQVKNLVIDNFLKDNSELLIIDNTKILKSESEWFILMEDKLKASFLI